MGSKPSSAPSGSPGRGCREPARSARQPTGCHQLSQARAAEFGARERFVKAYDSNLGAIRRLFPRDRDQQTCTSTKPPTAVRRQMTRAMTKVHPHHPHQPPTLRASNSALHRPKTVGTSSWSLQGEVSDLDDACSAAPTTIDQSGNQHFGKVEKGGGATGEVFPPGDSSFAVAVAALEMADVWPRWDSPKWWMVDAVAQVESSSVENARWVAPGDRQSCRIALLVEALPAGKPARACAP